MNKLLKVSLLIVLCLTIPHFAEGVPRNVDLTLSDGRRVKGRLTSVKDGIYELVLKKGTVKISEKEILRIEFLSEPKKVSLTAKNQPLSQVLLTVAEQSQKSIIIPDEVKGQIDLSLNDISWDKALDGVLASHGYQWILVADESVIVVGRGLNAGQFRKAVGENDAGLYGSLPKELAKKTCSLKASSESISSLIGQLSTKQKLNCSVPRSKTALTISFNKVPFSTAIDLLSRLGGIQSLCQGKNLRGRLIESEKALTAMEAHHLLSGAIKSFLENRTKQSPYFSKNPELLPKDCFETLDSVKGSIEAILKGKDQTAKVSPSLQVIWAEKSPSESVFVKSLQWSEDNQLKFYCNTRGKIFKLEWTGPKSLLQSKPVSVEFARSIMSNFFSSVCSTDSTVPTTPLSLVEKSSPYLSEKYEFFQKANLFSFPTHTSSLKNLFAIRQDQYARSKLVFICPTKTLIQDWKNEFFRSTHIKAADMEGGFYGLGQVLVYRRQDRRIDQTKFIELFVSRTGKIEILTCSISPEWNLPPLKVRTFLFSSESAADIAESEILVNSKATKKVLATRKFRKELVSFFREIVMSAKLTTEESVSIPEFAKSEFSTNSRFHKVTIAGTREGFDLKFHFYFYSSKIVALELEGSQACQALFESLTALHRSPEKVIKKKAAAPKQDYEELALVNVSQLLRAFKSGDQFERTLLKKISDEFVYSISSNTHYRPKKWNNIYYIETHKALETIQSKMKSIVKTKVESFCQTESLNPAWFKSYFSNHRSPETIKQKGFYALVLVQLESEYSGLSDLATLEIFLSKNGVIESIVLERVLYGVKTLEDPIVKRQFLLKQLRRGLLSPEMLPDRSFTLKLAGSKTNLNQSEFIKVFDAFARIQPQLRLLPVKILQQSYVPSEENPDERRRLRKGDITPAFSMGIDRLFQWTLLIEHPTKEIQGMEITARPKTLKAFKAALAQIKKDKAKPQKN